MAVERWCIDDWCCGWWNGLTKPFADTFNVFGNLSPSFALIRNTFGTVTGYSRIVNQNSKYFHCVLFFFKQIVHHIAHDWGIQPLQQKKKFESSSTKMKIHTRTKSNVRPIDRTPFFSASLLFANWTTTKPIYTVHTECSIVNGNGFRFATTVRPRRTKLILRCGIHVWHS